MQGLPLVLMVACGLSAPALAGDAPELVSASIMQDGSTWASNFRADAGRGLMTVYSGLNTNISAGIEFNSNVAAHSADDFSLIGGPAQQGQPTPIRTFGTYIVRPTKSSAKSFDMVVNIWNSFDDSDDTNMFAGSALLGTFRVEYRNLPDGGFWTGDLDISALNITLPGASGAFEIMLTAPGGSTPLANGAASVCNGNTIWDSTTMSLNNEAGTSEQMYWRDGLLTGNIRGSADKRYSGLTQSRGMLAVRMKSDQTHCPADFNNDGFTDIFDFVDFIDAFESGCN